MAAALTNPLGMELVAIAPGSFTMGQDDGGDYDERPAHRVTITRPFAIATTEVTNAQYEQFAPDHRDLRGKRGLSTEDDEAVVFVSWHEAMAFCDWLSAREGKPYRLPTEAEWEFCCRAGTTTAFSTGDELPAEYHKHQQIEWDAVHVALHVGVTPANPWGLHDMHGNVEEWCLDWYGPYVAGEQTDPTGPAEGLFRVTRGGSHSTETHYLRSANRMGTLPEDRHWLIGFRVVQGEMPPSRPAPAEPTPRWATEVGQDRHDWPVPVDMSRPYFAPPLSFVRIAPGSDGPMYSRHNHCPDITPCPNGDLLATWYSTREEQGRELTVVAARLRRGASRWDEADVFFKAPDRNMHATSIWWDRGNTLYHFNGLAASYGWANLSLLCRTSTDNGATWSAPHWMDPEHGLRHMPVAGVFRAADGAIVVPCDAVPGGDGGTAIHLSYDGGESWADPGLDTVPLRPAYGPDVTGGTIAGIHAKIVQLKDGRLMAFGRGDSIDGHMPRSLSSDMGKTWTYGATPFPPITSSQRLVLMRLAEGPILLASFAESMQLTDAAGKQFEGHGLYAALSWDEGETWPVRKLVTPGAGTFDGGAWTRDFAADATHAEPMGYLAATQAPDGIIHLISSAIHYRFNLEWVREPNPAPL